MNSNASSKPLRGRRRRKQRCPFMTNKVYQIAESSTHPISFLPTFSYEAYEVSSSSSEESDDDYYTEDENFYPYQALGNCSQNHHRVPDRRYTNCYPEMQYVNNVYSGCPYCTRNVRPQCGCQNCSLHNQREKSFTPPTYREDMGDAKPSTELPYTVKEPSSDSDIEHVNKNTIHTGPTIEEISD